MVCSTERAVAWVICSIERAVAWVICSTERAVAWDYTTLVEGRVGGGSRGGGVDCMPLEALVQ